MMLCDLDSSPDPVRFKVTKGFAKILYKSVTVMWLGFFTGSGFRDLKLRL